MKLTRFELYNKSEKHTIGIITGGIALGLLEESDIELMNRELPIPILKIKNISDIESYFTEEGLKKFIDIIHILKNNLSKKKNKLKLRLLKKEIDIDIKDKKVLYFDKWQVIIKK